MKDARKIQVLHQIQAAIGRGERPKPLAVGLSEREFEEMADADFGYVGSGPGKITLYKGKEVIKRSVPEDIAVEELINLLKESEAWVEPALSVA